MPSLIAAMAVAVVWLASGVGASRLAPADPRPVQTIATIRGHVDGFAQSERQLAWLAGGCNSAELVQPRLRIPD